MELELSGSASLFRLPDLGEGIAEGEIARWFVEPGEAAEEDDPIVEVVTDKASVIISAPAAMLIEAILLGEGEIAKVGEALFRYRSRDGAGELAASAREASEENDREGAPPRAIDREGERASADDELRGASELKEPELIASAVGDLKESAPGTALYEALSPEARRGLLLDESDARPRPKARLDSRDDRAIEREPISRRRSIIASKMRESRERAVQASLIEECELGALIALRAELEEARAERDRDGWAKLSFLPFFIKAVALSLEEFPRFASRVEGDHFELDRALPIGVAVDVAEGLLVPVLHGARGMPIFELSEEIARLSEGARASKLRSDELRGSIFTITSLGKLGGLFGTPILNPPELGILGVHRASERAVVRGGEIVIRSMANLSLSFDHQWIDGAYAARFLAAIIARIERPARLFAE